MKSTSISHPGRPVSGWKLLAGVGLALTIASAATVPPPHANGQLLAFTAAGFDGDGYGGIWLVRPNGTDFRQVTSFANPFFELDDLHGLQLPDDHPVISPDGKKIAFVSNRGHAFNKELYLMDINGANLRRLTDSPDLDTEPSWSPDGQRLVFSTARYGNMDLAILDVATLAVTRVTTSSIEEVEPAWSPDGHTIAFTRAIFEGVKEIWLVETNGTSERRIFDRPGEDHDATWNPAGTKLTITSEDDGSAPYGDVFVINADGSGPVDLTTDLVFGAGDPAWSPDGTKIAFFHTFLPILQSPQHMYVMNANGTGKLQLEDKGLLNVHPNLGWLVDSDEDGRPDYLENRNTFYTAREFSSVNAGDLFGHALIIGDLLQGPGVHTLAVGMPGQGGGRVSVRAFTANGFLFNVFVSASGATLPLNGVDSSFWGVTSATGGHFGQTLAAGDFDGNGFKEIVIGAPGQNRVFILDGKATAPKRVLADTGGFGTALATGDFNRDGFTDLAVGAPAKTVSGLANAGAVLVFWGSAGGLTQNNSSAFDQGDLPVGDVGGAEAGDQFGFALAAGDVVGNNAADLIVSAPGESYASVSAAGAVFIVPGTNGATLRLTQTVRRDARSLPAPFMGPQAGARFGEALALGRFGGVALATPDLAVGAPSQNLGGVNDAGLVAVYSGSIAGLATSSALAFCRTNLPGATGLQSIRFGHSLCAGDFSGDAITDLAVAAPRHSVGATENGSVFLIHGARPPTTGITSSSCTLCPPLPTVPVVPLGGGGLHLASAQRVDLAQCGGGSGVLDHFGGNLQLAAPNVLAAFDFDADGQSELFIGVPEANALGESDAGLFAIRFGLKVGQFTLSPRNAVVEPAQPFLLELQWKHPNLWTDLDTVQLRLADDDGIAFWLRFDEATRTLSLFDPAAGDFTPGQAFGDPGVLANAWASVDLAQSQLVTSGPEGQTVTMRFLLNLAPPALCRTYRVELFASDDFGNAQGFDEAGTLAVGDCAPRLEGGDVLFRFPTEAGHVYTVEARAAADNGTWVERQSFPGDGGLKTFREPANQTHQYYRVRAN